MGQYYVSRENAPQMEVYVHYTSITCKFSVYTGVGVRMYMPSLVLYVSVIKREKTQCAGSPAPQSALRKGRA